MQLSKQYRSSEILAKL